MNLLFKKKKKSIYAPNLCTSKLVKKLVQHCGTRFKEQVDNHF